MSQNPRIVFFAGLAVSAITSTALAQEPGPSPDDGGGNSGAPSNPGPSSGPSNVYIPGYPAAGTSVGDLNGHLPSSSRASTDTTPWASRSTASS